MSSEMQEWIGTQQVYAAWAQFFGAMGVLLLTIVIARGDLRRARREGVAAAARVKSERLTFLQQIEDAASIALTTPHLLGEKLGRGDLPGFKDVLNHPPAYDGAALESLLSIPANLWPGPSAYAAASRLLAMREAAMETARSAASTLHSDDAAHRLLSRQLTALHSAEANFRTAMGNEEKRILAE